MYEGGPEKRSSLDSVPQALFFSVLSGKEPVAVIYNTAGESGKIEYRINIVCDSAGVKFLNISLDDFCVTRKNKARFGCSPGFFHE